MEVHEIVRRWQAGESLRAIARALRVSRNTVDKYVQAAVAAGLHAGDPPPDAAVLAALGRLGRPGRAPGGLAPAQARLAPHREQIARWVREERLQLTRVQELLAQRGVAVSHSTLCRFRDRLGLGGRNRTTVRLPEWPPGEAAELDFGRLGRLAGAAAGAPVVWGLVVVLCHSRHCFVWPLVAQTLAAVVEGLEEAWRFFGGLPGRLILDNFPAAVAGTDPLAPRATVGFLEYSQARGFLVDPARPGHPRDKPHVERGVPYVRERFWKGAAFAELAEAQRRAARWCLEVAGQRVHGTTRELPLVAFRERERARLTPLAQTPYGRLHGEAPYDVPLARAATVRADHHVAFLYALYSAPVSHCPPGTKLEVHGDRGLVRLYRRGELVKVHPRQPPGGRRTDPADLPPERVAYALRSPERLVHQAAALGPNAGRFAERLLAGGAGPVPWAALRQAQKLLRLGERYTAARLDAACARALGFDLLDVRRLERILVLALDREAAPVPPLGDRLRPFPPPGRFARPGGAFARRPRGAGA